MKLHLLTQKVLELEKDVNLVDSTDLTETFLHSSTKPNLTQIISHVGQNNTQDSKKTKNIVITFCLERYFYFLLKSKNILNSQFSPDELKNKNIDWLRDFFAEFNGINLDKPRINALTSKGITVQNKRPLFYATCDLMNHLSTIITFPETVSLFILKNFRCYSIKTIYEQLNKSRIKNFDFYPNTWKKCPIDQQLINKKTLDQTLTETNDSISLKNNLAMNELINGHKWPFFTVMITL